MTYNEVTNEVARKLQDSFKVAVRPDHPLIFGGPDILAGSQGVLYGFFIQRQSEIAKPGDLLIRLAKSRLALPSHSVCALLPADLQSHGQMLRTFELNFDEIVGLTDIPRMIRSKVQRNSRDIRNLKDVRSKVLRRTSILIDVGMRFEDRLNQPALSAEIFREVREKANARTANIRSWSEQGAERPSRRFVQSDSGISAAAAFIQKRSVRSILEPVLNFGIRSGFILDNSVPYPQYESFNTPNVLFVDIVPHIPHDPLKPVRCAAFSGWLMLPAHSFEEYEEAVSKLRHRLSQVR